MEKQRAKTETELIASVANINDAEAALRFAQRAKEKGLVALEAACRERARSLKPARTVGRTTSKGGSGVMKTHAAVEMALPILIEDYKNGKDPTTYTDLAVRCNIEPGRWFGQVTDLIDAACALAGVPSFALIRVRDKGGDINDKAWRNEYSHLRDRIIAAARGASWSDADFIRIQDALSEFSSEGLGNKKAWGYVSARIDIQAWAGGDRPSPTA